VLKTGRPAGQPADRLNGRLCCCASADPRIAPHRDRIPARESTRERRGWQGAGGKGEGGTVFSPRLGHHQSTVGLSIRRFAGTKDRELSLSLRFSMSLLKPRILIKRGSANYPCLIGRAVPRANVLAQGTAAVRSRILRANRDLQPCGVRAIGVTCRAAKSFCVQSSCEDAARETQSFPACPLPFGIRSRDIDSA